MNRKVNTILCPSPTVVHHASMDPCISVGDGGGDASRRYLYTPVSITQADNECRLEGGKTHEIFHFLSKKVGGARPPRPPPIYARAAIAPPVAWRRQLYPN